MFGKSKKDKSKTDTLQAAENLRQTEDMLKKKTDYLEKQIEKQVEIAKLHGKSNKKLAIDALKKKKRLEKQLQQVDGTLSTVEFQREQVESSNITHEVLANMNYASKALKASHKKLNVDNIQDMFDDIQEQTDNAKDISDMLANTPGFGDDLDDDELLAELEALDLEEVSQKEISPALEFPSVPNEPLPVVKNKPRVDHKELADLQQWAS